NFRGDIENFDFSAHSGREQLLEYAKKISPELILLTHGDPDQMVPLFETLKKEGFDVKMPELGEKIEV
ncbi:MAG: MBL fold metallo-hydrolase RNA specificity domain-containing protein, partial [Candidatus Micrarchaeota archaeon]